MINCFKKTNTQIYTMIPPSFLLKSTSSTDLYAEIEERIPNTKVLVKQISRISQISQYTEVKSENTLKKSKDLQGFHWYILEYPEKCKMTI